MVSLPGLFFSIFNCVHEEALFLYINVGLLSSAVPDVSWHIGPGHFPPRLSSHSTHSGCKSGSLFAYSTGLATCRIKQNGRCIIVPQILLAYHADLLWVMDCGVHAIVFFAWAPCYRQYGQECYHKLAQPRATRTIFYKAVEFMETTIILFIDHVLRQA
jgi:hypothetical protein